MFSVRSGWIRTCPPPPRPASPRRWRPRRGPDRPPARRAAPRPGRPGASAPPRARRDRRSPRQPSVPFPPLGCEMRSRRIGDLLDRVGHRGGGDRAVGLGVRGRVATTPSISSGVTSGRAASWIATSSVSTACSALATDWARVAPPSTTLEVVAGQLVDVAGGTGDDDRTHRAGRTAGVDRPLDHRPAGKRHEGLRAAGSEPLPGAGGRDDRGDAVGTRRSPWRRSAPPAARRGIPPRLPRLCRART